jgi:WD40 repeat protein
MKPIAQSLLLRWPLCWAVILLLGGRAHAEPPRTDRLGDPLPKGAIARLGTMRLRHDGRVTSVAFAPDGKTLASASVDGTIRIWETATGRELRCLRRRQNPILGGNYFPNVAYSPDGKLLASAGTCEGVVLWDAATGIELSWLDETRMEWHGAIMCLAFAPDGKTVALGKYGTIAWWNVATRTRLRTLEGEHDFVISLAYLPDGKTLVYTCHDQEIGLCDPATGKVIRTLHKPRGEEPPSFHTVACSPDGKTLLVSEGLASFLLDATSGKEVKRIETPLLNSPPVFARNGEFVAAMTYDVHPWLWDWKRNKAWEFHDDEGIDEQMTIAVSPDSKLLASGGSDGRVRLWDIAARKEIDLPAGDAIGFGTFALSRDGKTLAALDGIHQLRLWSVIDAKLYRCGRLPNDFIQGDFSPVYLALSPDASQLAAPGRDKPLDRTMQVLDATTNKRHWHAKVTDLTRFAAYSPDGKLLAASVAPPVRKPKVPGLEVVVDGSSSKQSDLCLWDAVSGRIVGRLSGHTETIVTAVFSPDGKRLVTSGEDHTLRVWDVAERRERHRLKGHGGGAIVSCLAFSADGSRLASGGDDSRICVWDAASGRRLHRWAIEEEDRISCLALSAEGKWLLANAGKGRFRLWEVASATAGPPIEGHSGAITFAAFLPDGRSLLTASRDGTALAWELAALRRRKPLPAAPPRLDANGDPVPPGILARLGSTRLRHSKSIRCAVYSPDGTILATAPEGHEMEGLRFWDAASGKEIRRLPKGRFLFAYQIAFSPDGKLLATLTEDSIQLWDVASGANLGKAVQHKNSISCFGFTPDGKSLIVSAEACFIWDLDRGERTHTMKDGLGSAEQIVFSAAGQTLVACKGGNLRPNTTLLPGQLEVWDMATGKRRRSLEIKSTLLRLAPDGRTFVFNDPGNCLHVCSTTTGAELWQSKGGNLSCVYSVDGKYLLSGERGKPLLLREAVSGKEVSRSSRDAELAGDWLCLSPDRATLAAASGPSSHQIELWDVTSGRERRPFRGHRLAVSCVGFAPDNRTLVSGSKDGTLRVWDVVAGKELRVLIGSRSTVNSVSFSPDGKMIASGDKDNVVRLWDAITGKEVWRFSGPESRFGEEVGMQAVRFTADGRTLMASSVTGIIYLWDTATRQLRHRIQGIAAGGGAMAISPNGKLLACVGDDGLVRLWDAATGRKVREIVSPCRRSFHSVAFHPDGKLLALFEDFIDPQYGVRVDSRIAFYELASGKELFHLNTKQVIVGFTPDGCYLLTSGGTLWDMSSGRDAGERSAGADLHAVSPDGRLLAGTEATTILLYPMPHPARRPIIRHEATPRELQALWTDLSALEPARAWPAMCRLIESPRQSVAFLQTVLNPHPPLDRRRLDRWLANLDSDQFAVRETARKELIQLADLAKPGLRRTLDGKPSLEVRRQVLLLLEQIEDQARSPDSLRILRVTTVLERIGTADSMALLRRLAGGAAEARLTREAAAALQRLTARSSKP